MNRRSYLATRGALASGTLAGSSVSGEADSFSESGVEQGETAIVAIEVWAASRRIVYSDIRFMRSTIDGRIAEQPSANR